MLLIRLARLIDPPDVPEESGIHALLGAGALKGTTLGTDA